MQIAPPSNVVNFRGSWLRGGTRQRYPPTWRDVAEKCANAYSLTCFLGNFPLWWRQKKEPAEVNLGREFNKGKGDKTWGRPGCSLCHPSFCFPRRVDGHLSAFYLQRGNDFCSPHWAPGKAIFHMLALKKDPSRWGGWECVCVCVCRKGGGVMHCCTSRMMVVPQRCSRRCNGSG